MTVDPKILSRIKKCLALGQSSEPHEAAAAMRQAQKMMREHGVDQATIEMSDIGIAGFEGYTVTNVRRWELLLIATINRGFGTRSYVTQGYGRKLARHSFIGTKDKVELAAYTGQVLYRQCLKARNKFVAELVDAEDRATKSRMADDFCLGWALGVYDKILEFANPPQVQALIDKAMEERVSGEVTAKDKGRKVDGEAIHLGKDASKEAQLYRPMEGQEQRRLK